MNDDGVQSESAEHKAVQTENCVASVQGKKQQKWLWWLLLSHVLAWASGVMIGVYDYHNVLEGMPNVRRFRFNECDSHPRQRNKTWFERSL